MIPSVGGVMPLWDSARQTYEVGTQAVDERLGRTRFVQQETDRPRIVVCAGQTRVIWELACRWWGSYASSGQLSSWRCELLWVNAFVRSDQRFGAIRGAVGIGGCRKPHNVVWEKRHRMGLGQILRLYHPHPGTQCHSNFATRIRSCV